MGGSEEEPGPTERPAEMSQRRQLTNSTSRGSDPCSEAAGWNIAGATAAWYNATQCLSEVAANQDASMGGRVSRPCISLTLSASALMDL